MAVRTLFAAFLVSRYSLEERNSIVQLLLRNADDDTGDWLWETSTSGTLQNVSASLASAFGNSREWLENRNFFDILSDLAGPAAFDRDERTGLAACGSASTTGSSSGTSWCRGPSMASSASGR